MAEAGNTSLSDGGKLLKRAETAEQVPAFGTSLGEGWVTGEHVDVLTRTLRDLQPAVREVVSLGSNREPTISPVDGQVMTTGPPKRSAA